MTRRWYIFYVALTIAVCDLRAYLPFCHPLLRCSNVALLHCEQHEHPVEPATPTCLTGFDYSRRQYVALSPNRISHL